VQACGDAWSGDSVSLLAQLAMEDEAVARERDRRYRSVELQVMALPGVLHLCIYMCRGFIYTERPWYFARQLLPAEVPGPSNVNKVSAHVDAGCLVQVLRCLDTA